MKDPGAASVKHMSIRKVKDLTSLPVSDIVSIEEPLEIRIRYGPGSQKTEKVISVTMRTPGNDSELATGFLYTEGIVSSGHEVKEACHLRTGTSLAQQNIVRVELSENVVPHLLQADRNFYTTSSCGVCGKESIRSIRTIRPFRQTNGPPLNLTTGIIYGLPGKLKAAQTGFAATGGIHACGLFTSKGEFLFLREDVGRHNALDKLIGRALVDELLPLNQHILLLSGRASFELIQKAAMAGIPIVAAIGAPSSLAIELAREFDITLLGFLSDNRFNIYNSNHNITIGALDENQD